jgi:hypothetical protein
MILRLLNVQGIAGLAASLALLGLLLVQKGETRHWRKQSSQFEQLYRGEQAAFVGTVANYRAAAEAARAADRAAAERVRNEQRAISERTAHDYEARLADARARANAIADRLRFEAGTTATDRGSHGSAAMSRLPASTAGPDQAACENRLPPADALTATEQAIQLDELINWVRAQAKVDMSSRGGPFETRSHR